MSFDMYFDIETGPSFDAELYKPVFEASRVLKDPIKIEADIAEKERAWRDKLALSALTGRVVAIGWVIDDGDFQWIGENENTNEGDIIRAFFDAAKSVEKLIGFNSHAFDLPFIYRRALRWTKVPIPYDSVFPRRRRLSTVHTDIMEEWCMFDSQSRVSLNNLARFFGLEGKTGNGKDFAELYRLNREEAVAYLKHDVELTRQIANRMGL
jgi:predicted PolB exonuclease-like 3'-5' exonuclease